MIGYTTIGTNDLERAKGFYDTVLAPLGGRRTLVYERSLYYGSPERGAMLGVTLPFDGQASLRLESSAGEVLPAVVAQLRGQQAQQAQDAW